MKALLLRVGIDKGSGGCLAPISKDGSYEFIPIPERYATTEERTYRTLSGKNVKSLRAFLPAKLYDCCPHSDPEFKTFTYGDPTRNKRRQLAGLKPGDLLVFYVGLKPDHELDVPKLFIIGHFTVNKVYDFEKMTISERDYALSTLRNNAHVKRRRLDDGLVIVQGSPRNSKFRIKALPLGDGRNHMLRDLESIFGYKGSILRAIGHWADCEEGVRNVRGWLKNGVPGLVEEGTRLFSYVLASDTGFAPNVGGGYCTLACCKPVVRGTARVGDWVVGTLPSKMGSNRLGYVMRVNEILTFDEYFNDRRFKNKKPSRNPNGDNIYYSRGGRFRQLKNLHHSEEELKHDTRTDKVLISSLFWYFGVKSPGISSKFCVVIKSGRGHRAVRNTQLIRNFVSWVSGRYRIGVLGSPRALTLIGGSRNGPSPRSHCHPPT